MQGLLHSVPWRSRSFQERQLWPQRGRFERAYLTRPPALFSARLVDERTVEARHVFIAGSIILAAFPAPFVGQSPFLMGWERACLISTWPARHSRFFHIHFPWNRGGLGGGGILAASQECQLPRVVTGFEGKPPFATGLAHRYGDRHLDFNSDFDCLEASSIDSSSCSMSSGNASLRSIPNSTSLPSLGHGNKGSNLSVGSRRKRKAPREKQRVATSASLPELSRDRESFFLETKSVDRMPSLTPAVILHHRYESSYALQRIIFL